MDVEVFVAREHGGDVAAAGVVEDMDRDGVLFGICHLVANTERRRRALGDDHVDFADLDGNLLISNDPFTGVTVEGGRLILPDAPGIGVQPKA